MTALRLYRDDGPLAEWISDKLSAGLGRRGDLHGLDWMTPPLLRLVEYASLIALTAVVDGDALPLCFAFLGVLAFHHYDSAYRIRHDGAAPPRWVRLVGGGWEGRLLVAGLLALGGALRTGLLVGVIGLGLLWVAESVLGWMRTPADLPPPVNEADVLE